MRGCRAGRRRRPGRQSFVQKRREVYASTTHWSEVDLLRGGDRTANRSPAAATEYQAFLSRYDPRRDGRRGYPWPIPLRERLPVIGVPLKDGDADVPLDHQATLDLVYRRGGYELQFDYAADPPPPMSADALAWCRARVAARGPSTSA